MAAAGPSPAAMVVGRALLAVIAGVADRVLVHLAEGLLRGSMSGEMMLTAQPREIELADGVCYGKRMPRKRGIRKYTRLFMLSCVK